MKVGDLVQLSSYGKKLKHYAWQLQQVGPDAVGILIKLESSLSPRLEDNYIVFWKGGKMRQAHLRVDLKSAKVKKETIEVQEHRLKLKK